MIRIEIVIDQASRSLEEYMKDLGFVRDRTIPTMHFGPALAEVAPSDTETEVAPSDTLKVDDTVTIQETTPVAAPEPEKRKRRTKAEMQADNLDARTESGSVEVVQTRVEEAAAVSEQDRQDEARETAETKPAFTLDDLRHAVGAYQKVHGIPAAVANIPVILGMPMVDVADADLADAIKKVVIATHAPSVTTEASVVEHIEAAAPVKTIDKVHSKVTLIEALSKYALRYDGVTSIQDAGAVIAQQDTPSLLMHAVGASALRLIKDTPETWQKATNAIEAAIESNPFKRRVRS